MHISELLKRKRDGDMFVGNMIVTITTFLIAMILILTYASWQSQLAVQDSVILTAGSYMQSIESTGYLTDVQKTQLINELSEYGITEIDLTGTTMIPAGYGQKVELHISGNLHLDGLNMETDSSGIHFSGSTTKEIKIMRSGTSYR